MRRTTWAAACLVAALAVARGAAADPATYFYWYAEDGVVGFTDDPKRIPARYREQRRSWKPTDERVTPMQVEESETVRKLRERLDRLRGCGCG